MDVNGRVPESKIIIAEELISRWSKSTVEVTGCPKICPDKTGLVETSITESTDIFISSSLDPIREANFIPTDTAALRNIFEL